MIESDQDEMIKFLLKQIEQRQSENAELASQVEELEEQLKNLENQDDSVSLSNFQPNRSVDELFSELFPISRSSSVKPKTQYHIDDAIDKIFKFAKKDPRFS